MGEYPIKKSISFKLIVWIVTDYLKSVILILTVLFLVGFKVVTGLGDPIYFLGRNLNVQILDQKMENTFPIKAAYRFVLKVSILVLI